jgi:hypothetical protein
VGLVPDFGAQRVMLIEVCVVLAQNICGESISILPAAAKAGVPTRDPAEVVRPALLLPPKNNPEIDTQAKRMKVVLKVILRFMACSFLI